MKRFIFPVVLLALSLPSIMASDVSVDEKVVEAINSEDWVGLNDICSEYNSRIESEFLKKLSAFFIHHFYNRPDSALAIAPDLLNNYQPELGGSLADVMHLFAQDLAVTGDYREAANAMNMLCEAFRQSGDSVSEYYNAYKAYYEEYRSLADAGNILKMVKPAGDAAITFTLSGTLNAPVSILAGGALNGTDEQFIWDTGAGVNVISERLAAKHNLRILDGNMPVTGYGRSETKLALADSLRLGEIMFYNVPFYIVNTDTGNDEANAVVDTIEPVIGIPVMLKLGEFQMDMYRSVIIIPGVLSKPEPSNICLNRSNNLYLRLYSNDRPLEMKFDTGMYNTCLSSVYYEHNREAVERTGKPFLLRMAGIGGVKMVQSYILPEFACRIGKTGIYADSVYVQTQPTLSDDKDGTVGFDMLVKKMKVIVNFKDMFISVVPELRLPVRLTAPMPSVSPGGNNRIRMNAAVSPAVPVSESPSIETKFIRGSNGGITAEPVYPDR